MKTLVATDFLLNKPNIFQIFLFGLKGVKVGFSEKNKSWYCKKIVKGRILTDGWFYPFDKRMYRIYFPHGIK
jgi:hypothetical protein